MSSRISNPVDHYNRPIPLAELSQLWKNTDLTVGGPRQVASTSAPRRDVPNDKEEVAGGPEDHLKGKPGDAEVPGVPFLDCSYGSQTSPDDYDFAISLHNWHGQLEITFLQQFCCAGNLRALLASPHLFPDTLRPLIPSLQELYESISATIKKTQLAAHSDYLTDIKAEKLVHLLNAKGPSERWAVASV
ncbi:hypothetical protein PCASD_23441 [Puccinia coronata f. sp. avenae]|uniref:Uncharacterized protein n=1 Tax=Puccinia coronata f. sp. avenae TaxID=200324 RepID=A0A2N5SVX3_9BASI|nr:hypothetical protein PCASD_23441 [Puccinia coronata f. sp. avenae]